MKKGKGTISSRPLPIGKDDAGCFETYHLDQYLHDVEVNGLEKTWDSICSALLENGRTEILDVHQFGELYEMGLAVQNKFQKKRSGQYYTPQDIAQVMCRWLADIEGENLCDAACGTGELILTYLETIGRENAVELIKERRLFLYDIDKTALNICKTAILLKYGKDLEKYVQINHCDFLSSAVSLPPNAKTISNPPYSRIQKEGKDWKKTDVLRDSRELYSLFMEKIVTESRSAVIITPYSFISGGNFYSLRQVLSRCGGEIYSFDNVPGTIFCGRKHGIFNTNCSNSVRAAVTVVRSEQQRGFRLTPLIRFKNQERSELLTNERLEKFLSPAVQVITPEKREFYKCFPELQDLYQNWVRLSEGHRLADLVRKEGEFVLSMPDTCRYYTTASSQPLNRRGQISLFFDDRRNFNYVYSLVNSSFVYWHWRLFDGGIVYPRSLLLKTPVFFHLLTEKDHLFFERIADEMVQKSGEFKIVKNNLGAQENIRFPRKYRDEINKRMLKILNADLDSGFFDLVHSNSVLEM